MTALRWVTLSLLFLAGFRPLAVVLVVLSVVTTAVVARIGRGELGPSA